MTTTELTWEQLHDATVLRIEILWGPGLLFLDLRTGSPSSPEVRITGTSLRRVECPRRHPWGASRSVNDVRGPYPVPDGTDLRLEIELQSGDTIVIEAAQFELVRIDPHP